MYNNKYYRLITQAKDFVEDVMSQRDPGQSLAQELTDALRTRKYCSSINARAAIATVIVTGSFENYEFGMPRTVDCLKAFRRTRTALSKGRKLQFEAWRYDFNTAEYWGHETFSF